MDSEYIQNLRYKLQKRVKRLNSAKPEVFYYLLEQFWTFLHDSPILAGILENLTHHISVIEFVEDRARHIVKGEKEQFYSKEFSNTVLFYLVIKKCVKESRDSTFIHNAGKAYGEKLLTRDKSLDNFRDIFLEPFYEYLDEHLDDQKAILALLSRYKHKCEWFQRDSLMELSNLGERKLAEHLYEYLYDQGLNFMIEPSSASGEADLVSIQKGDEPLIADAKIFDGKSRGKPYIIKGFRQIYDYTKDYNEPFGYLIIYKICKEELKFPLSHQTQSTPFVTLNNKTIFLVTIDIHNYEKTASKRGTLKTIEITEEDLIKDIS